MSAATEMSRLDSLPTETLNKLIEMAEGGALPAVTSEDNGDVLTVVNGEWDKAAPGGGGGGGGSATIVTITPDESWETFTADKTFAEITAACNAGACVILLDEGGGFYDQYNIHYFGQDSVECHNVTYLNVGQGTVPLVEIRIINITSDGITFSDGTGKLVSAT